MYDGIRDIRRIEDKPQARFSSVCANAQAQQQYGAVLAGVTENSDYGSD